MSFQRCRTDANRATPAALKDAVIDIKLQITSLPGRRHSRDLSSADHAHRVSQVPDLPSEAASPLRKALSDDVGRLNEIRQEL
jgi:hypothetical protein